MTSAHRNRILKGLPPRESRLVSPHLKHIMLKKDVVLYEAGQRIKQVYFPEHAMVSYVAGTSDGETIEVGVVGHEGVVGIGSLIEGFTAFRAVVQIPGSAYVVNYEIIKKELARCDVVHHTLSHYTKTLLVQVAQTAVCNKFHSVEQRFCRWLLTALDKTNGQTIPMTQDALARVLGTRRASISGAAGLYQRNGLIRYTRGNIAVLNRKQLEIEACECYETIAAAHR